MSQSDHHSLEISRERAVRLFTFLEKLSRLRTKSVLDVDQYEEVVWFSDIPQENECRCIAWELLDSTFEHWIEIKKPKRKPPPELPKELSDWLLHEKLKNSRETPSLLNHITQTIHPTELDQEAQTVVHNIDEYPNLKHQWNNYLESLWTPWAKEDQRLVRASSELTA